VRSRSGTGTAADALAAELEAAGVRVMYDDRRAVSAGVKFKDAELIGVPSIVIVGKGLADGVVEVRDRRSGERRDVPVADAAAEVTRAVRG
jgi:prolyl-tRNA synthetase